ncbi:MAG: ethanolamine ammonia-lyase small subunit EutC [Rhodobacteraceae bacterium HLUCCO18]|nr:MAG: ethanolamine ammonia-lyase small subunit EutC [Rhodobacteraceae bacterium HLUCCO18]
MKPPSRNAVPGDIAAITEARLTFGQRGRALDTRAALRFSLDHARAREAVMAELDMARIAGHLAEAGLEHRSVTSAAATRDAYIRRPDLGRTLPGAEAERLAGAGPVDVAIVLGDGLSGIAANLAGPAFVTALATRLSAAGLSHGPVVIAAQARVALGDPVAMALGAQTVVVALGERPGLSAADSLGVYITRAPRIGTPDSARNCLSNIREGGMDVETAADRAMALIRTMRRIGTSGVALSQHIAGAGLPER